MFEFRAMTRREKLLARLLSKPKDLTWQELQTLLSQFGYVWKCSGGSHGRFADKDSPEIQIRVCAPHPGNIVKGYAMKQVYDDLKEAGFIK